MTTAGVDVGGTKVLAALVDDEGRISKRVSRPTDPKAGTASLIECLDMLLESGSPTAIGIGAAAYIEFPEGRVAFAPNLVYEKPNLKEVVATRFGLPTIVDNDANAAAWAEHRFGAGRGAGDMVLVTVGTGIGGGMVIGGEVFRGARGFAMEVGHMTIVDGGPECACGRRGCLEALASGTAIAKMARDGIAQGSSTVLNDVSGGDPEKITGAIVSEAAMGGDEFATAVMSEAGRFLGVGLANLANLFDPQIFVIGGGGAEAGEYLLEPAKQELEANLAGRRAVPEVLRARLGNEAGVVGAADLAAGLIDEN